MPILAHTAPVAALLMLPERTKQKQLKTSGWIYINLVSLESTPDKISNITEYM